MKEFNFSKELRRKYKPRGINEDCDSLDEIGERIERQNKLYNSFKGQLITIWFIIRNQLIRSGYYRVYPILRHFPAK